MILDVGCGVFPHGTVNCDLYVRDAGHRGEYATINPKTIRNFVLCDGQHLPFKNACFNLVYSSHVIEHTIFPEVFLMELVRVSKSRISLKCPYLFGEALNPHKCPGHHHHLNKRWFSEMALRLNCYVHADETAFFCLPHKLFPLIRFCDEITVQLTRKAF